MAFPSPSSFLSPLVTIHASMSCTPTLSANADVEGPSQVSTFIPLTSTRTASAAILRVTPYVCSSVSAQSVIEKHSAMSVNAGLPDLARSDDAKTYVEVDAIVLTARPTALVTADWPRRYNAEAAHRKPFRFVSPVSSSSSMPNSLSSSLSSASWNSPSSSSSCMSSSARLRAVKSSSRLSSFSSEYSSKRAISWSSGCSQS